MDYQRVWAQAFHRLTDFYQELEDAVSTFLLKSEVLILTEIDAHNVPTETKDIILSYPPTTQVMVDSHCEILWADNYGANLGRHPIENHAAGLDDAEKQAMISQQRLRFNMLGIYIKNSLTTDTKHKLRAFNSAYTFKTQYDGDVMLFFIVKLVKPDTRAGFSDTKSKLENMKMPHFKHDIYKANLQIVE